MHTMVDDIDGAVAATGARVWRMGPLMWALAATALGLAAVLFREPLGPLLDSWEDESYSHGILMPFIAAFLLWQRKDELEAMPWRGSWLGMALVVAALGGYVAGELATLYKIGQYALVLLLGGLLLALLGPRPARRVWAAVFVLFLAVPLPGLFYEQLSAYLQQMSSVGGVWLIRLAGIDVLLEGNVIDLGPMQLEVAEACNGLRYLFPLIALGFVAAYFYQAALWKKVFLFVSVVPITVVMNSVRIGLIGITVEYWGLEMAEGVLHDFEGWVFFGVALAVLLAEALLLSRVGGDRRPLQDVLGLSYPAPTPAGVERIQRRLSAPFVAAVVLLGLAAVAGQTLPERAEAVPERRALGELPVSFGEWSSDTRTVEEIYIDALGVSDHLMRDFNAPGHLPVNLWISYYESQRKERSAHSPRACLPAGGYEIVSLEEYPVEGVRVSGQPLVVNRSVMVKGDHTELVYYWFQQRGRVVTGEYMVKWYIFWDAVTRNRTDGALVRLIASVPRDGDMAAADRALQALAARLAPVLPQYVPD